MHTFIAFQLVSTAWLAGHLRDTNLVILHVARQGYEVAHIPRARQTDLAAVSAHVGSQSDADTSLTLEMLPPAVLRERLRSYGISDQSRIVVYAGNDNSVTAATRVVYTLAYAGLATQTSLLDGGLTAWTAEHRSVTTEVPRPAPGTLAAAPVPGLIVDAAWVEAHLRQPGIVLIDARSRPFYTGEEQGESRSGHIATARSLPFTDVFDQHTKLRSRDELAGLFRTAGAQPGDTIVAYCHIGMQATAVLFAARMVGYPVRLYDGSFEDWSRRKDLPVDR